jgi:hypothetical protein
MIRKIVAIGIISFLLLLGVFSSAQTIEQKSIILNQGIFEAQLGFRRDDRPTSHLEGNYNMRGRIIVVRGIFTSSDFEGRFQGTFIGNTFFMKIPVRGGTQTIVGRIRISDDYSDFSGSWMLRGFDSQGWISGEFITRDL